MGDVRYQEPYSRILKASDRAAALQRMKDDEIIAAIAATARKEDTYLANVLATEAINRTQRTRAIVRATGEGMLAIDQAHAISFMNPAAERLLRVPFEAACRLGLLGVLAVEGPGGAPAPLEEHPLLVALERGETCEERARRFLRADGTAFPASCVATPVRVEGEPRGAVMVLRDETESLAVQEALRESEVRLRTLVTGAPVILFALGKDGRFTLAQGKGLEDIGGTSDQIVGLSAFELERYGLDIDEAARRALAGEEVERVISAGGFSFQTRWAPIVEGGGEVKGAIGVATNITQLKRAQDDMQRALSLLEATLEAAQDGILVVDRAGKVMRCNEKFLQMWRLPEPVEGDLDAALADAIQELRRPEAFRARLGVLDESPWLESADVLEFKDGRVFERYSKPQHMGAEIVGRVWSFRDVTERRRTETLLLESEQRYRSFFDNNLDGVATVSLDGFITDVNPAYCDIVGYTRDELIGRRASDLIDPERRAQDVAVARASLAGPPRTLETRLVHKDGHLVDVRGTARPIVVGGVTVGSFGVARDVTQRKRAEEALRRSRKRLAQILEAASVGLCLQDAGGSIVMANAAAEEVLGRPREELVGRPFGDAAWKVTTPEGAPVEAEDLPAKRVRATGRPLRGFLCAFTRGDGARRVLSVSAAPLADDGGGGGTIVMSFTDVTEPYETRRQLREAEQRYRSVFDLVPDGLGTADPDGRILSANRALARLLGRDVGEIVGTSYESFVAPGDVERVRAIFAAALGGTTATAGVRLLGADGRPVRVRATAVPIVVDGRLVGVHGVVRPEGGSGGAAP